MSSIRRLGSSGPSVMSSNAMAPRMSPIEPSGPCARRAAAVHPAGGFSPASSPPPPAASASRARTSRPVDRELLDARGRASAGLGPASRPGRAPTGQDPALALRAVTFSILIGPASGMTIRPRASAKSSGNCSGSEATPPRSTATSTRGPGVSPFLRLIATVRSAAPSASRLLNSSREAPCQRFAHAPVEPEAARIDVDVVGLVAGILVIDRARASTASDPFIAVSRSNEAALSVNLRCRAAPGADTGSRDARPSSPMWPM